MKFMISFVIWQIVIFLVISLAIKYLSNYKNRCEQDRNKIDRQIHIAGWLLGIGIPSALWFAFSFLAIYK